VGQIDKENQANKQEKACSDKRKVVAPCDKKFIRDKEGQYDEAYPCDDLRAPETVLDRCASVFGRTDSEEDNGEDGMEESQGKVDSLNRDIAITLFSITTNIHIVKSEMRKLLHCPVSEHEP